MLNETTYSSPITIREFRKLFVTGVAYHHAGLGKRLRRLIETQFREKRLIVLVSTTTRGAGINLPASRVYFLETMAGHNTISPIKYRNMAGRAGRPQYREQGESVILATNEVEMQSQMQNYILNSEPKLESYLLRNLAETRSAFLAWISQGLSRMNQLIGVLSRSFSSNEMINEAQEFLLESIRGLVEFGFIQEELSGSELPRPEVYLVSKWSGEPVRICLEAKEQRDGTPIESHKKALSPRTKCRGDSTHMVTIGWPSFSKNLNNIARDRGVTIIDSTTFSLIYVWIIAGYLDVRPFLKAIGKNGLIQPDAFDPRSPRWWPQTRL